MMEDKLQEIIELLPYSIRYSGEIEELLDYANEQAERVEELEEENKELESLAKMQHDAKIEIEKRCLELEEKLKDQIDSNWKLDKINRMWLRESKRYREAIAEIENAWKFTKNYQEHIDVIQKIINELEGEFNEQRTIKIN